MTLNLTILGEYNPDFPPHAATGAAITHSSEQLNLTTDVTWISTVAIDAEVLAASDGLWIAPGSPYLDMQRTLDSVKYARENHLPCFGTCGGFQHMMIEYARNVLQIRDAGHAEYDPYASALFISEMECPLAGQTMRVKLQQGSQVQAIYASHSTTEQYYCNFGINPEYQAALTDSPLCISGRDDLDEIRIVELPSHPFFVATLFVPQAMSTAGVPHPLVSGFLKAMLKSKS